MAFPLSSVLALPRTKPLAETTFSPGELEELKQRGARLLDRLVTPQGIYASSALDWRGSYHAFFGRDTAITAGLIWETEQIGNKYWFSPRAVSSLISLAHFQGKRDHPVTGEELGKIPHEMRTNREDIEQLLSRQAQKRQKPWHINPFDHYLKNWDSADATPLWIIMIGRWAEASGEELTRSQLRQLRIALQWCLHNLHEYGGLAGFKGADMDPRRRYGGLFNQGWKDSHTAYLDKDGKIAPHPIYDVYVNGAFWAALRYGAGIFAGIDERFAKKLDRAAQTLRRRFNGARRGFRFKDKKTGLWYFAEAIDARGHQLRTIAADPGLLLWTYHRNRSIVYRQYLPDLVKRLMKPDLFNPQAGIRTYSHQIKNYQPGDVYHRGPNTYWPFESALIASGLDHFGYRRQATKLASAMLKGAGHFNSCIELFVEDRAGRLHLWKSSSTPQTSSADQAWTAAAIYYASTYLQKLS